MSTNNKSTPSSISAKASIPVVELISGSTAGIVSRCIISPLDVIKIRLQIQQSNNIHPMKNITSTVRQLIYNEGITSLWKGNTMACIMVAPFSALSFTSYHTIKRILGEYHIPYLYNNSNAQNLICGSVSGIAATLFTYPADLIRTRLAAQQEPKIYTSITHAIQSIIRYDGVTGLYTGLTPTLLGIVPLMALQFASYEHCRALTNQYYTTYSDTSIQQSICGFTSGIFSKFCTMPLDVIKKRYQIHAFDWQTYQRYLTSTDAQQSLHQLQQHKLSRKQLYNIQIADHRPFNSMYDCIRGIIRYEGIHGLFKGTIPSLLKAGPNSAIMFLVYEQTHKLLTSLTNR